MEKVKGGNDLPQTKPEDFKTSFVRIAGFIKVLPDDELKRIVEECDKLGNYSGLINQCFGGMAKRFSEMHKREDEIYGTALTILPSLATTILPNEKEATESLVESYGKEAVVKRSIEIAKEFISQVKKESEK